MFPASRGLFSFAFAGLTSTGKRTLIWVEIDRVEYARGYLATESSRDTSCCVGPLNNSGNTVKKCAGHSGLN